MKTPLPVSSLLAIELWSKEREIEACRESNDATAGAPVYVAVNGSVRCVTRRCATLLRERGIVYGGVPARDSGAGVGEFTLPALRAIAKGQSIGLTFTVERINSSSPAKWMLHCPEMHCSFPTDNVGKSMMLLCAEWSDIMEAGL